MRAFTLFLRTYGDAQRAVEYLRSEQGDAESIAPSLYTGRGRKKADPPAPSPAPTTTRPAPSTVEAPHAVASEAVHVNGEAQASPLEKTHENGPFMG
jgi:hypothetical protein